MRAFYQILLFTLMLMPLFKTSGQKVSNSSYGFMLDKMLSHSVRELSVSKVPVRDVVLVDAREKKEYDVSKIEGAIWVGYDDFDLSRLQRIEKNAKVVVYCSVGYRSEKIAEKLLEAGYTDVANLYGGIFEWVNQDQVVVDQQNKPTKKVHAFSRIWGVWLNKGEKVY